MKFDEKILNENCLILCKTSEQSNELRCFLHQHGYTWASNHSLRPSEILPEDPCVYRLRQEAKIVTWSYPQNVLNAAYDLLNFEDICTEENQVHKITADENPYETITQAVDAMSSSIRQIETQQRRIQDAIEDVKKAMALHESRVRKI